MTFLQIPEAAAVKIQYPNAPKTIISFKNKYKSCYQIVFLLLFFYLQIYVQNYKNLLTVVRLRNNNSTSNGKQKEKERAAKQWIEKTITKEQLQMTGIKIFVTEKCGCNCRKNIV